MSELSDDFRDLGFELARFMKQEIDKMRERAISTILFIEEETKRKINRDIASLESRIVQNAQFELNKQVSDRINEINRHILKTKTQYIERFIEDLKKHIRSLISKAPEKYFSFISEKMKEHGQILKSGSKVHFNSDDLKLIKANPALLSVDPKKFVLDEHAVNITAGFQLTSHDSNYLIDFSFESLLDRNKNEISKLFMQDFPVFEVILPDSAEIYHQKQSSSIKEESKR